jgi:hypothetical protein
MESRVELFALIRRDARVEGLSVHTLAARHKVHRRTVRQALESPTQAQEAFLEGHIEAFNVLCGIPTKHIRYENLTRAVTAMVFGQG